MPRNDQKQFKNFSHKPLVGALLALFLIIPTVAESAEPAPADMCRPCDAAAHAAAHKHVRAKHHRKHSASGSARKCSLKRHYKQNVSASAQAHSQQASATATATSTATAPKRLVLVPPCQTISSKPIYMELQSPEPSATANANATATANAYAAAPAYTPASTSTNTSAYTYAPTTVHNHYASASASAPASTRSASAYAPASTSAQHTYAPTTVHNHYASASAPASTSSASAYAPASAPAYKSTAASAFDPASADNSGSSFLSKLRARSRFIFQLGVFNSSLGRSQDVYVADIHDIYTVTQHNYQNGLVGLGYYVDSFNWSRLNLWLGLNAFYFAPTMVKGDVIQEALHPNLSYRYSVTQFPIYLGIKSLIKTGSPKYDFTFDAGVGPSIVRASNVQEYPRNPSSIPEQIFSRSTHVVPSANIGVGLKMNKLIPKSAVECGYRFFLTGQTRFNDYNSEPTNGTLNTGKNYVNAVMCSIIF